jgi:hypothetical protein
MTRSTGTSGSMILGFFFCRSTAERIAARSTRSGTPVKSWRRTRETMKGTSAVRCPSARQPARARTSASRTRRPSQFLSSDSSTMRMETGRREILPAPVFSSSGRETYRADDPPPRSKVALQDSNAMFSSVQGT